MNIDRKLATVRLISCLDPIEGADRIELATVDGWQVVVKKGEFEVGDPAIYFEIDSWVPHTIAPFLTKPGNEPKVYEGVPGQRLKTMRMKGQLSQGLLLPPASVCTREFPAENLLEGDDLTELLGIKKWERQIPAQLAGQVKGNFPTFLRKTDQERIQNVFRKMEYYPGMFELTEKLDGSSMTVYFSYNDNSEPVFGVCSRNLDLKEDENNTFWSVTLRDNIRDTMTAMGRNLAIQGELVGPGIQKNPYKLSRHEFYVFDIFDIDAQEYLQCEERQRICRFWNFKHVPTLGYASMARESPDGGLVPVQSVQGLLAYADGKSIIEDVPREGIVWKSVNDPNVSFKVISNQWLLGEKE